jgi:DNA mismatch repair protein MutS
MTGLTPMMQQYFQIKEQYKDAILFFRLGDFYEMFFEDAVLASKELEITLTGRDCGLEERAPMCGVPYHSVDSYIAKLIENGHKVAICEQTQDPADAKGLVERQVIRVITPGTVIESSMLDEKVNNYLLSLFKDNSSYGFSGVDLSTGEFFISEITTGNQTDKLMDELSRLRPSEILINEDLQMDASLLDAIRSQFSPYITPYHEWAYQRSNAARTLLGHFKVQSLDGFGCQDMEYGICAAGALLEYLSETQKNALQHINQIKAYFPQSYMVLDATARRNLELIETIRGKGKKGSLLWLLDKTNTAMGGRMLRQWVQQPLVQKTAIEERLDAVEELINNPFLSDELKELLTKVYDLERLASRVAFGTANARDMLSLKQSLETLPSVKDVLAQCKSRLLSEYCKRMDTLSDIHKLLEQSIFEDPPVSLKEGSLIKAGWNETLDHYRQAMSEGKNWIAALEQQERDKTGIKNLKIGFNKVFGYYIDVTKSYYDLVPENYIRKQTLANSERYITQELKEVEDKILGAEDKSIRLEYQLFTEIREQTAAQVSRIQAAAAILAALDALHSLAQVSYENHYTRPEIREDGSLNIKEGRHPVVEKTLPHGLFVPNNTSLKAGEDHLMIITGPNMAGKSTYMRQAALIVLMAQIGCFVPAQKAEIGIVDRIFTRVGASDDLASGQSTFMVEMSEVANILNNATSNSLLILDEIGRGTSTFDGLSIAYAVIEHICQKPSLKAKTLFATHYHELTELEGRIPGVKNYCIAVKEQGDDIIFLRRIVRGGADKSFGIQVAKLAGLPDEVIERAKRVLARLEESDINKPKAKKKAKVYEPEGDYIQQLDMFHSGPSEVERELMDLDVNTITPIEAIGILHRLSQMAKR